MIVERYKVFLTEKARDNLLELRRYVVEALKEENTASEYLHAISKAVMSLDEMPMRYKIIEDEPFNSMKLRRMIVKNFYVYYSVDKRNNTVFVRAVIYSRTKTL